MKYKKILIIVIIALVTISIVKPVQAVDLEKIWQDGADFLNRGKNGKTPFDGDSMKSATDTLYNIFFLGGIAIAAIVGTFLGIKFMTESTEGKAKIKEALIPFCIGCFIIFGGFTIWKITMNLFSDIESTELSVAKTTKIQAEACDAGNHLFDNYSDHECNNCGSTCSHTDITGGHGTYNDELWCTCGFKSVLCTSTSPNNTGKTKPHSYDDYGRCQECGYKCEHTEYVDKGFYHECKTCGFKSGGEGRHTFNGGTTCTLCGKTCTHPSWQNVGSQWAECTECHYRVEQCQYMGRGQHTPDPTNTYCTKCHYNLK